MRTIVIGLGNPILGDDGAGWRVIEQMQMYLPASPLIDFECLSLGGIGLMEHLIGYDRALLIDAFVSEAEAVGSILSRRLDDLPNYSAFHITSAHDTSLQHAIQLGKTMGAHLPAEVMVIGIATRPIHEFGETLSAPVAEAIPEAARLGLKLLDQNVTVG